ncbi:Ribosome-associated factor Y [Acholeplasma oculi]|uniref:Ribosome hibernation promoting factor n=1 Tax=Acholeplasma oculi TaxID=35623 RepID=A0A061AI14_9MOLU|nr:ribosome-associated translation inhibitor RaiA [Acholeplasma oculi]CDR31206.1 Sigma 54 modulation protein / S30EA ribosomal protein [Acholeplasma oculi]SKC37971.1 SSU ribosomal protein S30P/sigma 54 modulation protein [Acholeplasma oculi]SUT91197.1 Ribosome-associated factor Y [Acholeplasma oculi]
MRYEIIGKNGFTPTDAIKAYVEKKLNKVVQIFDAKLIEQVRVVLRVYKEYSKVEVTIPAPYIILRSEVRDADMYAAIDKSVDKLSQQIRKHKSKIRHHFENRGQSPVFTPEFDLEAMDKEVRARQLVKSKKFAIQPMSVDNAIAQMELSGHDFFIFLDEKNHHPQIVYRREDGDYAVIETTPELYK